jgi:F-type H+-transporting ATPase subunit gamma
MSGKLKEIKLRIGAVKDTQQITKAMKMVSASKLKRAQDAIKQVRPYSEKLNEVLGNIVAGLDGDSNVLTAPGPSAELELDQRHPVLLSLAFHLAPQH